MLLIALWALVTSASAARWTDTFQSKVAAETCESMVAKAKEVEFPAVKTLSDRLSQQALSLPTPAGRALVHLCRLQAWSIVNSVEPTPMEAVFTDARAAVEGAGDPYPDALVFATAFWATEPSVTTEAVDKAMRAIANLDAPRLVRAAKVQGLRPVDVTEFAKAAYARRLRPEANSLTLAALQIALDQYGAGSLGVAKVAGDLARYAMPMERSLTKTLGDASLAVLDGIDVGKSPSVAASRIEVPTSLYSAAMRLSLPEEKEFWKTKALEEVARVSAFPLDVEARRDVLHEWMQLNWSLQIDGSPERRRTLAAAAQYASTPGAEDLLARLLTQSAVLELVEGDASHAERSTRSLRALLTTGNATSGKWKRDLSSKILPVLESSVKALSDDVAPGTAKAFGAPASLENTTASLSSRSQGDRARLALEKIPKLLSAYKTAEANAILSDPAWMPPPIGASWTRSDQAIWNETAAHVADESGKPEKALELYETAWQGWQPAPPVRAISILLEASRLQRELKKEAGLRTTIERLGGLTVPSHYENIRVMIQALAAARLEDLHGAAESAVTLLTSELRRYAGTDWEPETGASLALIRSDEKPKEIALPEREILQRMLIFLLELEDDHCLSSPEVVLDHASALAYVETAVSPETFMGGWKGGANQAGKNLGSRSMLIEQSIRAFEAGRLGRLGDFYRQIQNRESRVETMFPKLPANLPYELRDLARFGAASAERVLLSKNPERIKALLDSTWFSTSEPVFVNPNVYGSLPAATVGPYAASAQALPKGLIHFLSYSPMRLDGRCNAESLKKPQVAAFVVRDGRVTSVRRIGSLEEIDRLASDWMALLEKSDTPSVGSAMASRLWTLLLKEPLNALGPQEILNIRVSGDVPVLPWSVLLREYADGATKGLPVRMLPSASNLVRLQESKPTRKRPAIFAGPAYGPPTNGIEPLPALFHSEREGVALTEKIGGQLYIQQQATSLRLSAVEKPSVLHISSHTRTLLSPALRDAVLQRLAKTGETQARVLLSLTTAQIALANANLPGKGLAHGGFMSALMLSTLDLNGTQLVTLSMCRSAVAGDRVGISSPTLQWAAHQAGAKSVVASLWDVDDRATAAFLSLFYDGIGRGLPPAQALVAAQDIFRSHPTEPTWRAPQHWGAFVVSGTNEVVRIQRGD